MKRVLILGGTYFLGRNFLEQASDCPEEVEFYVWNRGTIPLGKIIEGKSRNMKSIVADRRDAAALEALDVASFDAVVDFCAYNPGDIKLLFDRMKADFGQYILISTVDVLRRGTGQVLDENAPYEEREFSGESGAYISGKVALEKELKACCAATDTAYTIIRPAMIYGPYNYAPREGMYFHWIQEAGQMIQPSDATGRFQLVYVKDVARSILLALCNEQAYNKIYHACDDMTTYESFAELLKRAAGKEIEMAFLSVRELTEKGIPLPFPLLEEESECYIGEAIKGLGLEYTDLLQGMTETYQWYVESHPVSDHEKHR